MHFLKRMMYSAKMFSNKVALVSGGVNLTYLQLCRAAYNTSQQFTVHTNRQNKVCLIIAQKSISLYQSLLACFFSNLIYMPVNVNASLARNKKIVKIADPDFICIGDCRFDMACHLLCVLEYKTVFVLNVEMYSLLLNTGLQHNFILISSHTDIETPCYDIIFSPEGDISYLFFTSGSTGVPKGVPISNHNLSSYIDSIFSLFRFTESDRVLQSSDIAFDLSIHEILTAWCAGATLYIYDDANSLGVSNFIDAHKITHGFFVPSSIPVLEKQCAYFKLSLLSLKKMFFCGEVFPLPYARILERIAPRSSIVNLYGPTETTIACTYHFYRKNEDYGSLQSVPIGFAFPSVTLNLSHDEELLIEGDQVFSGYWPLVSEDVSAISYHTGDYVSFDARWGYVFHARKDDQWQIQGYRIEKNEVEYALRSVLRQDEIYVIPQYHESSLSQKLLAFSTAHLDMTKYKKQLSSFIPIGVIPDCCIQINSIPKLPNGKVDYKAFYALSRGGVCV